MQESDRSGEECMHETRDGTTWSDPGAAPPVQPFDAHVGPTTTIPSCPQDAFFLTFTPDLMLSAHKLRAQWQRPYKEWPSQPCPLTKANSTTHLMSNMLKGWCEHKH